MVKLVADSDKDAELTEGSLPTVTIFSTPQTTGFDEAKFCGKVYKAKGACAKQDQLIAWKDAWHARLKKRRENVITNAKKIAEKSDKFQKVLDLLKNAAVKAILKSKNKVNLPTEKKEPRTAEEVKAERVAAETTTKTLADEAGAVTNLITDVDAGVALTDALKKKEAWFKLNFKLKLIIEKFSLNKSKYIGFFFKLRTIMKDNAETFNFTALKNHLNVWATFKAGVDNATTNIVNAENVETSGGVTISPPVYEQKTINDEDITKWEKDLGGMTDATKKKEFETKATEGQKHSDVCFKKLAWLRGNALCLRTSGAANDFYDAATQRYLISKSMCKQVIPWCAPFYLWVAKTQRSVSALMNIRNSLTTTKPDPLAADASVDDSKMTDWDTCAKDKEACKTNEALLDKLCAQFTLSGENKKTEGDNRSMRYGDKTIDDVDKGTIVAPNKRLLVEPEADDGEGGVSPTPDASGANLEIEFESGDESAKKAATDAESSSNSS